MGKPEEQELEELRKHLDGILQCSNQLLTVNYELHQLCTRLRLELSQYKELCKEIREALEDKANRLTIAEKFWLEGLIRLEAKYS